MQDPVLCPAWSDSVEEKKWKASQTTTERGNSRSSQVYLLCLLFRPHLLCGGCSVFLSLSQQCQGAERSSKH